MHIEKISGTPLRYAVMDSDEICFTIGQKTAKQFQINENDPVSAELAKQLEKTELTDLLEKSRNYLSSAEKSPGQFAKWLTRKHVTDQSKAEIQKLMEEEKFLSSSRYAGLYTQKRLNQGKRPWFRVQMELEREGISKETALENRFDDKEAIKNSIARDSRLWRLITEDQERFMQKMQQRGFRRADLKAVLPDGEED